MSLFRTLRAYLELARPANVVTAWADILAGVAASGFYLYIQADNFAVGYTHAPIYWLLLATTGLYAGGVVLNDVFDASLDAEERPERAIPSGRASKTGASIFGILLLAGGIAAAFATSILSGYIAAAIALLAVCYDKFGKHHTILGPINMGLCRGGNLLLGVSAVPYVVLGSWYLALLPIVYIGAITAVSQGEVHGGSSATGRVAVILVLSVISSVILMGLLGGFFLLYSLPFLLFFAWLVLPSFFKAAQYPEAHHIRRAVRAGIMGLIPLNATLAAGFVSWPHGLIVLLLLPISIGLARLFAVT